MTNKELFEAYRKDVYRMCYYMMNNAADAEDICQEVFVTVFRSNWQDIEKIRPWIIRITVNQCLNVLRRRRTLLDKIAVYPHMIAGSQEKLPDEIVLERETAREWADYLSRLPLKIRAVIALRYIHGFQLAEIAEMLSIPLGTAKSRQHKGIKLMRKMLEQQDSPYQYERSSL
ncbi:RNA polymerase sigma factor [Paenibacillus terreus]|uniref:RNA polymerase sigma factor n=1 Tax=Paenibacillus terreus TaxID=1387834 RepID=A0ABV5BFF2_9BACL